ncbi:O-antigen ligase family protein [Hyphococcus sp.]|uniref:O-antigen ligase family protein n=1 Tax=Hyphococcus sp. TaxID=2038636 RepID=UPI00207E20A2|nr:MAG: hypothetical protein DHS20C04_27810 [Marinicaulis sp.]
MPVHLKAYIVVAFVSIITLAFFRKPFLVQLGPNRFNNWAITWMAVTTCIYWLTNYWLAIIAIMAVVAFLARRESLKPAIFLLLLCVVPTLGDAIPGVAGINKFIMVTPQLAIAAVVLMPSLFFAAHMRRLNKTGATADLFFFLFIALQIALSVRAPSFTDMLRTGIQEFLFLAPIYYVLSRAPKSANDIRILTAAIILPVIILSAISIPEFLRNWHFYYQVVNNWFGDLPFGYSMREGYLRATTSVFNPIVWGYVAMTAIGLGFALLNDNFPRTYRFAAFGLLVTGLLLSLSRGPWIGAIIVVGVYILLSKKALMRSIQAGTFAIITGMLSLLTPFGRNVIGLLPVVGGNADETIDYRQQLLDAAWDVILENPLFGSGDFLESSALQAMRQGQGIIDIVNTYLQVGLKSGLIGLSLFVLFFFNVLLVLHKSLKTARAQGSPLEHYCRAYLATLAGILVTIFTTSSEGQIPHFYWAIGAIGVALSRIVAQTPNAEPLPAAATPATPDTDFSWK